MTVKLSTLVSSGTSTTTSGAFVVSGSILVNTANPVWTCQVSLSSIGYNRAPGTGCGLNRVGDVQGADPQLGPLAGNGGTTLTHLPGATSPALDAIPNGTVGLCDATVAVDQRGAVRPNGTACDIGSVERWLGARR